jgi:AmiR/NasT family two-component response regulator
MNGKFAALILTILLPLAPLGSQAQIVNPINQGAVNNQIQSAINQQMVQQQIQQSLQNQLQQRQSALETQQRLLQFQTRTNVNSEYLTLQQLEVQQQLQLIQARLRALRGPKKHKP